ncbi:hypothetical protein JYU34_019423 [Plutella xylostella]|uniref:Uncharacterized protein n=1 Tax=Plutella xylostella TaxID=51655 RepID=A0ABQ7PX26_PLUXY|nr:hypothetical protein JYU34_019423 [Plutella xylostella]
MNNQLISKVIKFNNQSCPDFVYENPLLDRKMTEELVRSFVKVLNVPNQNQGVSNNLRLCVLENIRKLCQAGTEGHKNVDDNFTSMMTEFFNLNIGAGSSDDSVDRKLDAFLARKLKHMELNSAFDSELNPEILQAMINLNCQGIYMEKLSTDLIHWDVNNDKQHHLMRNLWTNPDSTGSSSQMLDDVTIKMKVELEKYLLSLCHYVIVNKDIEIRTVFTSYENLLQLVDKCVDSSQCFQMSISILNFIFITTNCDDRLQQFIPCFIIIVKNRVPSHKFMVLYPSHLSSVVILLDMDLDILESPFRDVYVTHTLAHLKRLHTSSLHDLIMLISHYPQWFDEYFGKELSNEMES